MCSIEFDAIYGFNDRSEASCFWNRCRAGKNFFFSPLNLLSVYIGGGGNIYIIWDGILEKIIESEARST